MVRSTALDSRVVMCVFRLLAVLIFCLVGGCTTVKPLGGGGGVTPEQAAKADVPLVVIGGWADPGIGGTVAATKLRDLTGNGRILAVHPGLAWSFDGAGNKVVDEVEKHFGPNAQVDVVGISMGGITARHAAAPDARFGKEGHRLNIRNLFTIASPHSGSQLANLAGFWGTGLAMRSNSPFLQRLARREADGDYPIVAYARTYDYTIGPGSALPDHLLDRGQLIWMPANPLGGGHWRPYADERILGDIARRLTTEARRTQ